MQYVLCMSFECVFVMLCMSHVCVKVTDSIKPSYGSVGQYLSKLNATDRIFPNKLHRFESSNIEVATCMRYAGITHGFAQVWLKTYMRNSFQSRVLPHTCRQYSHWNIAKVKRTKTETFAFQSAHRLLWHCRCCQWHRTHISFCKLFQLNVSLIIRFRWVLKIAWSDIISFLLTYLFFQYSTIFDAAKWVSTLALFHSLRVHVAGFWFTLRWTMNILKTRETINIEWFSRFFLPFFKINSLRRRIFTANFSMHLKLC